MCNIHQRVILIFAQCTIFCCVAGLAILAESSCASYVSPTQEFEQLNPLVSSNQALKFWNFTSIVLGPGHPPLLTDKKFSFPFKSPTSWHAGLWYELLPAIRRASTANYSATPFFSTWQLLPGSQDSSGHDISRPYFCKKCWKHLKTMLRILHLPW